MMPSDKASTRIYRMRIGARIDSGTCLVGINALAINTRNNVFAINTRVRAMRATDKRESRGATI